MTHLSMSLRQIQAHSMPMKVSSLLGLSSLELELLLEQGLGNVQEFYEQHPEEKQRSAASRGNYIDTSSFLRTRNGVKGKIPREKFIEHPEFIVGRGNGPKEGEDMHYHAQYNPGLEARIKEKLLRFKLPGGEKDPPKPDHLFSKRFLKERDWIMKTQATLIEYLCRVQEKYLETGNPFDLMQISQEDAAKAIGYSSTTASKLLKNLTIKLPEGKVIFAEEFVPGSKITTLQGTYALQQLQNDPAYFKNGEWSVSDAKLVPALKEKYGLDVARRTVAKYRNALENLKET